MNIWGHQRKKKAITLALKKEEAKKKDQCVDKVKRLVKAGINCSNQIRQLKKTRKKGKRLYKKKGRRKRASKS